MERSVEMGKTKVILLAAALLLCVDISAQKGVGHFEWERVAMDGHRSATGVSLSPSAAKEAALLEECAPAMKDLKAVLAKSAREMRARRPESELSNWLADAMIYQTGKFSSTTCDAAILNYGGIRVEMPAGDVTDEDLRSMLPFKNTVIIAQIRGDKLYNIIENMYKGVWEVLGGIRVVASSKGIQSVEVAGKPLDRNRLYSVVTNSFLWLGGDNICLKNDSESHVDTGLMVYDVIKAYLLDLTAQGKLVEGKVDGRITLTDYSVPSNSHGGTKSVARTDEAPKRIVSTVPSALTIIHTNDTHSHLEKIRGGRYSGMCGIVERAAFIDSVRLADGKKNVLLLDAGDYSQGTPYFAIFKGDVEVEAMNRMGYDFSTLGNHEWDNGAAELAKRLRKASFKTVLCNYEFENKDLTRQIKPCAIVRRGGLKIGVIGVLADITEVVDRHLVSGLKYTNPTGPVNRWADFLKNKKKCDMVIVLSHCGFQGKYNDIGDTEFAPNISNVDVIIGGHTHTNLKEPVYVNGADGKPVMIVTDYCWGIYAGLLKYYN